MNNIKITLFNDATKLRFNLTDITLKQITVNNNRVKIRFNEQSDSIEVTQDDIDFQVEFSYRAYMVPPVFADKGKVRVSI